MKIDFSTIPAANEYLRWICSSSTGERIGGQGPGRWYILLPSDGLFRPDEREKKRQDKFFRPRGLDS